MVQSRLTAERSEHVRMCCHVLAMFLHLLSGENLLKPFEVSVLANLFATLTFVATIGANSQHLAVRAISIPQQINISSKRAPFNAFKALFLYCNPRKA